MAIASKRFCDISNDSRTALQCDTIATLVSAMVAVAYAGFFYWGDSVTSHRDDVKILQLAYSSSEAIKCIGL